MSSAKLKISSEKAIEKIAFYLDKINELLNISYKEGFRRKHLMNIRIEGFIRAAFKDDDKKLEAYRFRASSSTSGNNMSEDLQKEYINDLNRMKNHLLVYRDELKSIIESKKEQANKIDEILQSTPLTQITPKDLGSEPGRDITLTNINVTIFLEALESSIRKSRDIPDEEKQVLIQKINEIIDDLML